MKVAKIIYGQSIRFLNIVPSTGQTLYGINLVRAFESRYGFLESPKLLSDFDLSSGITFRHGIFSGRTVIDKFMIYSNGMLAEAAASNQDCYDFISDVIEWSSKAAGISISKSQDNAIIFNSTVHIEMNVDYPKYLTALRLIGTAISGALRSYGHVIPSFELTGLSLSPDVDGKSPNAFKLERLLGAPFDSNLYFSSAPLSTADHLRILEELEAALER